MFEKVNNGILDKIAQKAKENFTMNPGDYFDDNGLLVCGKCKQKKQTIIPGPEYKVACACECDIKKSSEKAMQQKVKEEIQRINHLKNISLMDDRFKTAYFDVFKVNQYNEQNYRKCLKYALHFDEMIKRNQGLLLWGDVGTGKTFAAACIANSLLDKGIPVIMTSLSKIIDEIMLSQESEDRIIQRLNTAKLLILDDIGTERNTNYALEKVYNVIDCRYRKRLPIIVTTNIPLSVMKDEPESKYSRIYDRLFECCYPIQFTGPSWRRREAKSRYNEMERFFNG